MCTTCNGRWTPDVYVQTNPNGTQINSIPMLLSLPSNVFLPFRRYGNTRCLFWL